MCPVSDSAPLRVTLYTKEEVHAAVNTLKMKNPDCTRLLLHKDIVDVPDEETEETETYQNCWISKRKTEKQVEAMLAEEEKFKGLEQLPDVSGAGVSNMKEMCGLMEYLFANGCYVLKRVKDTGSCLYASIRRCTTLGRECSNTHLRRFLVMMVCQNHQFFYDLLKVAIAQEYGATKEKTKTKTKKGTVEEDDDQTPGPLSFCSLLEHILKRDSWGDKIVILLFSFIWQIRITILITPAKDEIRVRHNLPLYHKELDMVLILGGTNHFSGAGNIIYYYLM